jgi:ABC-2 type transport system permease protein
VIKGTGSTLIYFGFAVGTYFLTRNVIAFSIEEAHIGLFLLHRFISMMLFVFFLTVNVGNIIVAYSTLYKSQETSFLLTKPISFSSVFTIKFLESFSYSSVVTFLIGLSVLLGYGSYFNLDWMFYLGFLLFVFIPFMLIASALGVIFLMFFIKVASKMGVRLIISLVGVFYLISIYSFFKLSKPFQLASEVMKYYPNVNQYFGFLDPSFYRYLPNHWISESLYWIILNRFDIALNYIWILFGTCVAIFTIMILIAKRTYYSTWLDTLNLKVREKYSSSPNKIFSFFTNSNLERQSEAFLKKEFWQFFRDSNQWIHLSVITLLIFIFIASITKVNVIESLPFLQTISYLVLFLFNVFLISSIGLRFLYPNLSIEGETFWKLKSAPVDAKKIIRLKFLPAFLVMLVIAQVLNLFSHLSIHNGQYLWLSSSIGLFFISLALAALTFGMGAYFANYKENNPIRAASSQGASLAFLLTIAYMIFLVAVYYLPLNQHLNLLRFGQMKFTLGMIAANLVVAFVSAIISIIGYKISIKILKKDYYS